MTLRGDNLDTEIGGTLRWLEKDNHERRGLAGLNDEMPGWVDLLKDRQLTGCKVAQHLRGNRIATVNHLFVEFLPEVVEESAHNLHTLQTHGSGVERPAGDDKNPLAVTNPLVGTLHVGQGNLTVHVAIATQGIADQRKAANEAITHVWITQQRTRQNTITEHGQE